MVTHGQVENFRRWNSGRGEFPFGNHNQAPTPTVFASVDSMGVRQGGRASVHSQGVVSAYFHTLANLRKQVRNGVWHEGTQNRGWPLGVRGSGIEARSHALG